MNEQMATQSGNELARHVEQLSRLMEVSRSVAAQLDLEPLLQQIVDTATRLVNARMGGLLVLDQDATSYQYFKVSGWPFQPSGVPSGAGVLGLPIVEGISLRVDDVLQHPRSLGFPANHPQVQAFLSVPLLRKENSLGALFVGNAPDDPAFTVQDEELLLAFAAQATIAIENARLYAQADELARLRERQRIAQALHDTVAQMLFKIGLDAEWCTNNLATTEDARYRLQTIRRLAARSSDELRSAIFALRSPYVPSGDGLLELLQERVAEFQAQTGLAATLIVPPDFPSLLALVGEAVYRIVCEALSNVQKHARASAVIVSLRCEGDHITVTIQDDGVGLSRPLATEGDDAELHFGVATMRQLTRQGQGDFSISNNDDHGVMVKARFPVPGACVS